MQKSYLIFSETFWQRLAKKGLAVLVSKSLLFLKLTRQLQIWKIFCGKFAWSFQLYQLWIWGRLLVDHVDEWFSVFFIIYRCVVGASLATDMVGLTALLHGQPKSMDCFLGTYCNGAVLSLPCWSFWCCIRGWIVCSWTSKLTCLNLIHWFPTQNHGHNNNNNNNFLIHIVVRQLESLQFHSSSWVYLKKSRWEIHFPKLAQGEANLIDDCWVDVHLHPNNKNVSFFWKIRVFPLKRVEFQPLSTIYEWKISPGSRGRLGDWRWFPEAVFRNQVSASWMWLALQLVWNQTTASWAKGLLQRKRCWMKHSASTRAEYMFWNARCLQITWSNEATLQFVDHGMFVGFL